MELQQEPRATINHWKINSSSQLVTQSAGPLQTGERAACLQKHQAVHSLRLPEQWFRVHTQKWIIDLQQGLSHRL